MARDETTNAAARAVGHTKGAGWQIGVRRTIAAPAAVLWGELLGREGLARWLGPLRGEALEPGATYRLEDGTEGEVRAWRPGQQLRLTRREPGRGRASTVQLRLLPAAGGTTVAWHEEHLPDAAARAARRAVYEATLAALQRRATA